MERQVTSSTRIEVLALRAWKIPSTHRAGLCERDFVNAQNFRNCISEFLDVIVTAHAERSLLPVIIQAKPQQENELVLLDAWEFEGLLV